MLIDELNEHGVRPILLSDEFCREESSVSTTENFGRIIGLRLHEARNGDAMAAASMIKSARILEVDKDSVLGSVRGLDFAHLAELKLESVDSSSLHGWISIAPNLRLLSVTHVSDKLSVDDIRTIGLATSLKTLHLGSCDISRELFASVPAHPIEHLSLVDCRIADGALEEIDKWSTLRGLAIRGEQTTDIQALEIADAHQVQRLYLGNSSITDAGVLAIAAMEGVVVLELSNTPVTSACVPALNNMKSLETLNLTGTIVDRDLLRSELRSGTLPDVYVSE